MLCLIQPFTVVFQSRLNIHINSHLLYFSKHSSGCIGTKVECELVVSALTKPGPLLLVRGLCVVVVVAVPCLHNVISLVVVLFDVSIRFVCSSSFVSL